ncbi:unnamed protein product [Chrysoparadoxa australica]
MSEPFRKEYELQAPPQDGITCVRFAPTSSLLLASSWDKTVRVYDAVQNEAKSVIEMQLPVLSCAWWSGESCFAGGLSKSVDVLNIGTGEVQRSLGAHEASVKCMEWAEGVQQLVSGGWDSALKVWDPRAANALLHSVQLPGKVYSMGIADNTLVVATSGRKVVVFDVRNLSAGVPDQVKDSPLKFQTRCVLPLPKMSGYALSSIEGRVAVDYLTQADQDKKYAFKCHRQGTTVFPVNTMAVHPGFGTVATGGCDSLVNVWDIANKKRLAQFRGFPTSIASLDFNHDGTLLAIASSYTFEEGDKEHPSDTIWIKEIDPKDVRPKAKKAA